MSLFLPIADRLDALRISRGESSRYRGADAAAPSYYGILRDIDEMVSMPRYRTTDASVMLPPTRFYPKGLYGSLHYYDHLRKFVFYPDQRHEKYLASKDIILLDSGYNIVSPHTEQSLSSYKESDYTYNPELCYSIIYTQDEKNIYEVTLLITNNNALTEFEMKQENISLNIQDTVTTTTLTLTGNLMQSKKDKRNLILVTDDKTYKLTITKHISRIMNVGIFETEPEWMTSSINQEHDIIHVLSQNLTWQPEHLFGYAPKDRTKHIPIIILKKSR